MNWLPHSLNTTQSWGSTALVRPMVRSSSLKSAMCPGLPIGEALTAFAGVDPGVDESGQHKSKSNRASKVGSARLRKTLFQIMRTLLQNAPEDDPVYRFLDKKRSQGKPYYVYMTAGANKFLRIYYGKVKECLRNLEQES